MSTAPLSNKYQIKSLEEEIGLFDRKLAHLLKFGTFPSEKDRDAAAGALTAKRERLVRAVHQLTEGTTPSPSAPPAKKAAPKRKAPAKSKPSAKPALSRAEG